MKKLNYESIVFYLIAVIYVIYVWSIPIFVTQDGPSHLYNSKILLDIITNNEAEFYFEYLDINQQVSPNWFSSILLSFLLYLFNPIVAEKIFISLLVISVPFSFRYAIRSINPNAKFLSSLVFVLSNGYFLIYGFYNFQWSLVFFCFFIGYYIRNKETLSLKQTSILSMICLLTFITHPVGFIQIAFFIGLEIIRNLILFKNEVKKRKALTHKLLSLPFILLLPGILFIIFFFNSHSSSHSIFEIKLSFDHLLTLLIPTHLLTFDTIENYLLALFSFLVFVFFAIFCFQLNRLKKNSTLTSFAGLLLFNLFIYFFMSDQLAGGAYLIGRTTIYIYLLMLFLTSNYSFRNQLKRIYISASVIICFSFLIVRYPFQKKIGELAESYLEVGYTLNEKSTLLPLSFSNKGEINSTVLSPRIQIFKHISGYLGASKQLISFDNYEANTNYFPLIWKSNKNPYKHLSRGFDAGIEQNPPSVDITSYNNRNNCHVDYVMIFGDPMRFSNSEQLNDLNMQLEMSYQLIDQSDDNLIKLFINNNLRDKTIKPH